MRKFNTHNQQVLLQLYAMLHCSLARYLVKARPWSRRHYSLLSAILRKLAAEHQRFADEIARNLESRRQMTPSPTFPTEFTYYNDIAVEHLAPVLLQHQRYLIGVATTATGVIGLDREMKRILTRLTASLRKYADVLEELLVRGKKRPRSGTRDQALKLPKPGRVEHHSLLVAAPQHAA